MRFDGSARRKVRTELRIGPPPKARGVTPLLEVRFDSRSGGHPLAELFQKERAEARLIACRLSDRTPRRLVRWLDVEVDPDRTEPLLQSLRRRARSQNVAVSRLGPGRLLLRTTEPVPSICAATYRAGGICVTCPLLGTNDGESWRVILPRGIRTKAFLRDRSTESAERPAIAEVEPYRSSTTLTPHQDRALKVAYDLGYFAYPRRAALGEVARALGTGRSSTLEVLRRATVKLAGRRYGDELGVRRTPEVHGRALRSGQ